MSWIISKALMNSFENSRCSQGRAAQVLELWSKLNEDMREIKTAREVLSKELLKDNLPIQP